MALVRRSSSPSQKGVSLSRGPALLIGTVLLAAGLFFLYRAHGFPALSRFGSGHAPVNTRAIFHIFGVNGWSAELTAVAGGVLLLAAAQHVLAKTASFVVGVVLAGVAIIALADHHSALGLFAAGNWTMVLWGACAVALLLNVLMPRTSGSPAAGPAPMRTTTTAPVAAAPVATTQPAPSPPSASQPVPVAARTEPVTTPATPVTTPAAPVTTSAEPVTTSAEPVAAVPEPEPMTVADEPVTAAAPTRQRSAARSTTTDTQTRSMDPIRTEPLSGPGIGVASPDGD